MKSKLIFSFLFLAGLVLTIGLACSTSATPTPLPTNTPLPPPTAAPSATPPQVPPTPLPTPTEIPRFFTEEFTRQSSSWDDLLIGSGSDYPSLLTTRFTDDALHIELAANDMYYYYIEQFYDDVRLDINVDNLGVNSQNISLVCRMTEAGWYEFSVGSDGTWYLWTYLSGEGYTMTSNGGTTALRQGHETNDYGMVCAGDQIHLFVNGQELRSSPVRVPAGLPEGFVGFNISSLYVTPVIVEVNWFQSSRP